MTNTSVCKSPAVEMSVDDDSVKQMRWDQICSYSAIGEAPQPITYASRSISRASTTTRFPCTSSAMVASSSQRHFRTSIQTMSFRLWL